MSRTEGLSRRTCLAALLSTVAACASGTSAPPPSGVPELKAITYWDKGVTAVVGDVADSARAYVLATADLTGPDGDWEVRASMTGQDGFRHVRMRQLHANVPVWGGDIVVHASKTRFLSVKGNLVDNLDGFDVVPVVDGTAALATAKGNYALDAKSAADPLAFARESSELVIYPQSVRDARLAWHVVFYTEIQAGIRPGLWNYFIDAKSGAILDQFNAIHTLSQASGPGGNAKVPRTWTDALDVEPSGAAFAMDTARLQTYDLAHGTGAGTIVVGPLDNIGDAPINDAHGFAEQTLNMLQDWMGYNSIDEQGFVIKSRVHYSTNYENAFWDGTQMTYGDGATTFYPLSGDIDVVAHEIDHGFTTFHSNLTYSGMSGGMNESFSDIAGTVTEFYNEGDSADFDIGRDIFKGDAALRFMCDPTADGASIDNAADYNGGLDVHYSSGVMNKAFCLSARRLASGSPTGTATTASVRRAGTAWYLANADYWTASSTFTQGCQGVMDAAAALGFSDTERTALRDSWIDVGVYCDGAVEPLNCDDTFTTEDGEVTSPNYPSAYPNNFSRTYCVIPASGQPATLTFTAFSTELNYDFVTIKDATGTELSTTSGTVAPPDATSAIIVIKFTSDGSVTAPGWRATWSTGGTTNQPPTATITAPADGATVSGSVAVAADAADPDGTVSKVTFTLPDGTTVDDLTAPYTATWDSTTVADGSYAITAQAFDDLGVASTVASVTVDVSNAVACIAGSFAATGLPLAIPDNNTTGITSTLAVTGAGNVSSLALSLHITHTYRGDLRVILTSPDNVTHVVAARTGGAADDLVVDALDIADYVGRPAAGTWRLKVTDLADRDVGTLDSWSLDIVGDCDQTDDWSGSLTPNLPLVDNGSACSTLTISGAIGDASGTRLDIRGRHDWRASLRGTLEHGGVTVEAFPEGTFAKSAGGYRFVARPVAGLSGDVNGDWTLCIIDVDAYGDTGVLTSWSVHH